MIGTDNLKRNYDLIFNQEKRYFTHYFLIEANIEIPYPLKIADFINVYSLNQVNYDINPDHKFIQDFINKLKIYRDLSIQGKYYWLVMVKIVSLSQKPKSGPALKLSDVVDPEVGMSIHPSAILKDALNIFSIYFKGWFKQIASLNYFEESDTSIIIEEQIESIDYKESKDLTRNITTICGLRLDQFYLLEKCMLRFHEALKVSNFNLGLSLSLLISVFDPATLKYIQDKLIKNDISCFRKKFLLKFYPNEEKDELTEVLLDNLNYFYERYIHYGLDFIILNPKVIIQFNRFDKENLLVRIPSFIKILILFEKILGNFIQNLYNLKEDEEDEALYEKNDLLQRGVILTKINKPKRPGEIIFDTDTYRDIDYNDLQWFRNIAKFIEDLIRNQKFKESLIQINKALEFRLFNLKYYDCRKIVYQKILVLFSLKNYGELIDIGNQTNLTILPEENLLFFNLIAYSFAHLKKFEEAFRLINKLIEMSKNEYQKAAFFDSKGEFFQIQEKYYEAIKFYNKSLDLYSESPFDFHKETLQKLRHCYLQIGNAERVIEEIEAKIKTFESVENEKYKIDVRKDDKFIFCYDFNDTEFSEKIKTFFIKDGIQLKTVEFHDYSKQFLDTFLSKLVSKNIILIVLITPSSSRNLWVQELIKLLTSELKFSNINTIPLVISNEKILSELKYFEYINVHFELENQLGKLSKKIKNLSKINLQKMSQVRLLELTKSLLLRENFKFSEENFRKENFVLDFIAKEYYEDESDYVKVKN